MKAKLISDFSSVHGIGKILLVGEYQQERVTKFVFIQHTLEFITGFWNTITIIRVDNKNDALSVLEI